MRIKITDGDLLVVNVSNDFSKELIERNLEEIRKWLISKDLKNVKMVVGLGPKFEISILSVNDVFENTVFGGRDDQR